MRLDLGHVKNEIFTFIVLKFFLHFLGHEETRYIIMVLCPSKEKEITFIINLNLKLKSIGCHFENFRKQNQPQRQAGPSQHSSQTSTLGGFRVLLEIQLRYFNLIC